MPTKAARKQTLSQADALTVLDVSAELLGLVDWCLDYGRWKVADRTRLDSLRRAVEAKLANVLGCSVNELQRKGASLRG